MKGNIILLIFVNNFTNISLTHSILNEFLMIDPEVNILQ